MSKKLLQILQFTKKKNTKEALIITRIILVLLVAIKESTQIKSNSSILKLILESNYLQHKAKTN